MQQMEIYQWRILTWTITCRAASDASACEVTSPNDLVRATREACDGKAVCKVLKKKRGTQYILSVLNMVLPPARVQGKARSWSLLVYLGATEACHSYLYMKCFLDLIWLKLGLENAIWFNFVVFGDFIQILGNIWIVGLFTHVTNSATAEACHSILNTVLSYLTWKVMGWFILPHSVRMFFLIKPQQSKGRRANLGVVRGCLPAGWMRRAARRGQSSQGTCVRGESPAVCKGASTQENHGERYLKRGTQEAKGSWSMEKEVVWLVCKSYLSFSSLLCLSNSAFASSRCIG